MEEIEKKYVLCNRDKIEKFLKRNSNLIPVIKNVDKLIKNHFTPICLKLGLFKDWADNEEYITLDIVLKGDVEIALEKLDKFDDEYISEFDTDISLLIVDVKFV